MADKVTIHLYVAEDGYEFPEGTFIQEYSGFEIERIMHCDDWRVIELWLTRWRKRISAWDKYRNKNIEAFIIAVVSDSGVLWQRGDVFLKDCRGELLI